MNHAAEESKEKTILKAKKPAAKKVSDINKLHSKMGSMRGCK